MKKIIAFLICIQMVILPVYAEYDFSDEAQAEFDRNRFQPVQAQPVQNDFSKTQKKKILKQKNNNDNYINESDRTNYTPTLIEENNPANTYFTGPQPQLSGSVVTVPSGTTFYVTFDAGISSGSLEKNDRLTVRLTEDLRYNGILIAPAGSLVYGSAIDATAAGLAYGSGAIEINFNQILTPDGNVINISTEKIYMKAKSERAQKMTRDIVIGALGSMLVGAAFTALGGGDNWGENMLIYGGLGALGGGLRGTMQRGEDIQIQDGTSVEIKLTQPLNAVQYNYGLL